MNDMMSQNEIDALIAQNQLTGVELREESEQLSENEIDTLGEIGNISMGAAATALYTIIGRKVVITTPEVSLTNIEKLANAQKIPYLVVNVDYTEGFTGNNLYVLHVDDVKAITDIMMGGEGRIGDEDLSELHISAISEAMNQMMGGMATSLAEMFERKINISPPKSLLVSLSDHKILDLIEDTSRTLIQISFRMEIEGLADSSIMQLIPLDFGRQLVSGIVPADPVSLEPSRPQAAAEPAGGAAPAVPTGSVSAAARKHQPAEPVQPARPASAASMTDRARSIDVRPIQLSDFDHDDSVSSAYDHGIDIILDVPLQVSVELGQSRKTIKEVMELNIGSIITLDRVAGEPVDVVVNGKIVARGEVIVIDDNYGIRITEVMATSRVPAGR